MRLLQTLCYACLLLAAAILSGCAGTAMTIDPTTGALKPVQGWKTVAWHREDPAWTSFGVLGRDEFGPGPWWYGDPVWRVVTFGQGGIPSNGRGFVELDAPAAGPAAEAPSTEPAR